MRHPTQWLFAIVIFLLGGSVLGRITCSLLGKPALADLIVKITAIAIVALIVLFVILYWIACWKFRKVLKEQESESRKQGVHQIQSGLRPQPKEFAREPRERNAKAD